MSAQVPSLEVQNFLAQEGLIFDVRSPSEYAHAHIPGAISLPLFSDSERAQVGTLYKKVGQAEAIELGVQIVGPKLASFMQEVKSHIAKAAQAQKMTLRFYCWRGGMRSGFISWFINFIGYPSVTLRGGYKAYRRHVLQTLETIPSLIVIGGYTGCGKTELLHELHNKGEQVIDLEGLAFHKGSVYGALVDKAQPSTEHFENMLAQTLSRLDYSRPVFIEDESRLIGHCTIPQQLFSTMRLSPLWVFDSSKEERVQRILRDYGHNSLQWWKECTCKLMRRLGGEKTQKILQYIDEGMLSSAIVELLEYYDKAYLFSIQKRQGSIVHLGNDKSALSNELLLLKRA